MPAIAIIHFSSPGQIRIVGSRHGTLGKEVASARATVCRQGDDAMQFLEWLDKHFASNCHYYYADDLVCPFDLLLAEANTEAQSQTAPLQPQADHPDAAGWQ
jgi:hypothetical protein